MPPTLAGAIVEALDQGQRPLAALVTREAAARLPGATRAVAREVRRHLALFALIGHEARLRATWPGHAGRVLPPPVFRPAPAPAGVGTDPEPSRGDELPEGDRP
jgi:hypothetical protein